jgi:archaemetzincin
MPRLDVVPIYLGDRHSLVETLAPRLQEIFQASVRLRPCRFEPEICYDSNRGQYNSTLFLKQLLRTEWHPRARILGVAGVDLFIPVLSFVFGEAQLKGRAAVVSIHRLRNEAYGLPRQDELTADRLVKEATHELGHTFGLIHCPDASCVMRSSTYVEEIDLKQETFCSACLQEVRSAPPIP